MPYDALLLAAALEPSGLLLESLYGVEGPAGFEGAGALHVFAFEPESDGWSRGCTTADRGRVSWC